MKQVVAVVSVLALGGCGSEVDRACDRAALDALPADAVATDVLAACPSMPEAVARALRGEVIAEVELPAKVWRCDAVRLEEAAQGAGPLAHAYEQCGWNEAIGGSSASFAWASGRPLAAILVHHWLEVAGYPDDDARRVAQNVLGTPAVPEGALELAASDVVPGEASAADLVLTPDGLRARGEAVDLASLEGVVTVLLPADGSVAAAPLGELVHAGLGRVSRIELVGRAGEALVAVPVEPTETSPGPALAGAVEVHVHAGGILLVHGPTLRTTEAVAQDGLAARITALMAEDVPDRTLRLVPHDAPAADVARVAQILAAAGPVHLLAGDLPCAEVPEGSACVAGGSTAVDGSHRVLSPFVIDAQPLQLADYQRYVEAGACVATERRGSGPQQVDDLTHEEAIRWCAWTGRALPTEWQWEQAATAGVLVGADAGPGDWTLTAFGAVSAEVAAGVDPIGPCQGAPECEGAPQRVVRGGQGRAWTDRRGDNPGAEAHGVRCVSPWPAPEPVGKPVLEPLTPPDQRLLDLFHGSEEDPIKPLCTGVGGQAQLDCRDPVTYIIGNEPRADLFMPFLDGVGGGYIGVASDQNYSQAAIAQTRWLWLMDYDPKVVSVHRMNGAFIRASETPADFVDWYRPGRRAEAQRFVEEQLGDDELTGLALRNLRVWGDRLHEHYTRGLQPPEAKEGIDGKWVPAASDDFGWLRNPKHYAHIRTLWQQGRVRAVKGDMLGSVGMQGIGRAAREMGVPIRVYYTSNAPYAWGGMMEPAYRRNVRALPMDAYSIEAQTLGSRTGFGQQTYWHHSVVRGLIVQERLGEPGFDHVSKIVYDRTYGGDGDLTVLGVGGGE